MSDQNYCLINQSTTICENVVVWDGNTDTWAVPSGFIALVQSTTPTKIWGLLDGQYVLIDSIGDGSIGFKWDGTYLITNEPEPVQPVSVNTQEL